MKRTRPKNEEAPAAVGSSGEGGYEACTDEATSRKPKRKLGNVEPEDRYTAKADHAVMRPLEGKTARDTGEALSDFQATDLASEFRYRNGFSGKRPLRCERVNDITFKFTDGEMSRVPALNWWAGYNTSRACAWVINVGINSNTWLARRGDQVSGPLTFTQAKKAAINLAKGVDGDYRIHDAISHLNGLQARLLDREGAE